MGRLSYWFYIYRMRWRAGLILLTILSCNKDEMDQVESFSAKLVKQGICMNYVIQVLDSDFDSYLLELNWTNEFSDISYNNVFALESVCDFPDSIKEGDSFRFRIDREKENLCAVCLAYTAAPRKFVSITVIKN